MSLKKLYLILYASWIGADIIALFYFFIRAQELGVILTDLILRHALGALPLPIGLIIEWTLDPGAVILQVMIFLGIAIAYLIGRYS